MPDVGLLKSTEPVPPETKVVIRFTVEIGELPVYQESYDVDQLRKDVRENRAAAEIAWLRRLHCVLESREREGFSAALTRCLTDGNCCDFGHQLQGSVCVDSNSRGESGSS